MIPSDTDARTRLLDIARRYWEERLAADPVYATALGDRRFDHALRDDTPDAIARERARVATLLEEAHAVVPEELADADRLTLTALKADARGVLDYLDAGLEAWAVDPLAGPQVQFFNIESFQPVRTPDEGRAMVERWRAMGAWFDSHAAVLRDEVSAGRVAVRDPVEKVIDQVEFLLGQPVDDWTLLKPLRVDRPDWTDAQRTAFAADLTEAVRDVVRPALERYHGALRDEVLPRARPSDSPGLVHIAGGSDAYRRLIRFHTSLDVSPEELHATGLAEVERINAEMLELGGSVLGEDDRAAILHRLRTDPALYFATPDEVQRKAEESLARATAAIPDWFGRLPRAACEVVPVPEHEAKHSTIAYYRQPAADGSRPGEYYINTSEPESRPRYEAEALAYHEAIPGHHLQLAIAQELTELPDFRRFAGVTAFIEGWGLYTERLSDEMGLYSSDLDRIGILSFDAWRACRLVVDSGMHALGWTRRQAIEYLLANTALAENNIVNEVDRYITWPAQAVAYKTGQLEILRLRDEAGSRLGGGFDIRAFHDAVLGNGALPLAALREVVEASA